MKIAYVIVLVASFFCNVALASTTKGAADCGDWIKGRQTSSISEPVNDSWLVGYLSAFAVRDNSDVLKDISNESLYLWMDNYCRSNPLKRVDIGGFELYDQLTNNKQRKK